VRFWDGIRHGRNNFSGIEPVLGIMSGNHILSNFHCNKSSTSFSNNISVTERNPI
jgi:hypothetical protein